MLTFKDKIQIYLDDSTIVKQYLFHTAANLLLNIPIRKTFPREFD